MIVYQSDSDIHRLQDAPIARNLQGAIVTALSDWATSRNGLAGRLSASSWSLYGWTRRSSGYQKRQLRGQWGILPYVSPPRRTSYGGVGKFLYALTKPGIGHNVYSGTSSDTEASGILTVPAARGLNFARNGGIYLEEWGHLYPADVAGIAPRIERLGDQAIQKAID